MSQNALIKEVNEVMRAASQKWKFLLENEDYSLIFVLCKRFVDPNYYLRSIFLDCVCLNSFYQK